MTRDEFIEMIEGFEDFPFILTLNKAVTSPLKLVKCLSDSIQVLSNGRPAAYRYDAIEAISFDVEETEPVKKEVHNVIDNLPLQNRKENSINEAKNEAKKVIYLRDFSFVDRSAQLRTAVLNTRLEKEWSRIQNMIIDAQKNHNPPEKIKTIISNWKKLPSSYDCIEYYITYGEVLALANDYSNASFQLEKAGDYQNAAYYAALCVSDKKDEYLLEIFRKWIVYGKDCNKDVFASFMALCYSMRRGRVCAETIKLVDHQKLSDEEKNILRIGLTLVLSNYSNEAILSNNTDIDEMLAQLLNESKSENYNPEEIMMLKHADELDSAWEKDVEVGYILNILSVYGHIGKEKNDSKGINFNISDIASKELKDLISKNPQSVIGLKVVYRHKHGSGNIKDTAIEIAPAENLDEFIKRILAVQRNVSTEDRLVPSSDGHTYSGYIIKFAGSYGFIYKNKTSTANGVYFHKSELDEKLKKIGNKIIGIKVNCELGINQASGDKIAVNIKAAEDIESFLENNQEGDFQYQEENVDEKKISNLLKTKSPNALLQEYATTNRPFHALAVLEKSRDSFSYDKYVKHKIQLLQRTKSDDNELIVLLNHTISTSTDGSYIAHNLYFLGQVQYRCKQYTNVVATMMRLLKYRKDMKSQTQYTDSLFLISVAYYMLRDYDKADEYAKKLQELGAHAEETAKIFNRTFATEESIRENTEDVDNELSLQFDLDVAITPYIETLINSFSFGSISVNGVPSDFNPEESNCTINQAEDYIKRLIKYDRGTAQRNSPSASIAIAKIQKWLIQQATEQERNDIEISLRYNVSRALQIMARNTMQQSGLDVRVNLFYRMQQYKMSVQTGRTDLFNAYINAHYGETQMRSLRISNLTGTTSYTLMLCDVLCLLGYMENEFQNEQAAVEGMCDILTERPDNKNYLDSLKAILDELKASYGENDTLYDLIFKGISPFKNWLNSIKRDFRNKAELKQWNELITALDALNTVFLSENEISYVESVRVVVKNIIETDTNTQTAMKQNLLNQSINQLDELEEELQAEPTYILYSIFADMLSIMRSSVFVMLAEVMSHEPNIELFGTSQVNLGLNDRKEFILPLEFKNHAPSVQAVNLILSINHITDGVSLISTLPKGQNVHEGEIYSQSLNFRLDNPTISQVDIKIKIEYNYDTFVNYKNERQPASKIFNYTITFCQVEPIRNKYSQYAQQQTVRDEDMFFGRDELIQNLYDAISVKNDNGDDVLKGGNGIVLYGQRRSGKTSILYHLKKKIVKNMSHAIVVDLGSSGTTIVDDDSQDAMNEEQMQKHNENMTLQTLYDSIITGISDFIRMSESDCILSLKDIIRKYEEENKKNFFPEPENFSINQNPQIIFNGFLTRFKNVAKVEDILDGFRIVIFIDEFTYFNAAIKNKKLPSNFMEIWKGIISDSFITLIVAGQDNMIEFIDNYVNEFSSFHREWVTFLDKVASYKMVNDPIGEKRIAPESVDKLFRFTAGSPYLLMDICSKLVNWMNANKIYRLAGNLLDEFLVKEYMQKYEFKQQLFEPQYVDAGRLEWKEKIKLVLGLIARQNSKKVANNVIPWSEFNEYANIRNDMLKDRNITVDEMREIIERLKKRQVIEGQEGYQNRYRLKIPLYREWILRRGGAEYGNV